MNSKKLLQSLVVLVVFLSVHIVTVGQTLVTEQLKINFTSFTVNSNQQKVMIDWATDKKMPTNYFEVQRSSDGTNFKTIELVLGSDPKQTGCDCYKGFDIANRHSKEYFYRLKHVSADGEIAFSEAKMLLINK